MIVITGGAYQGKRQFAIDSLGAAEDSIYTITGRESDFSLENRPTIYGIEHFVAALLKQGRDPVSELTSLIPALKSSVIICDDISCGVVPTDPLERQWREAVGRCMVLLSREADKVYRVFCGLGTRLK